jgi:tetratricopeptide (TPR) repeat protein
METPKPNSGQPGKPAPAAKTPPSSPTAKTAAATPAPFEPKLPPLFRQIDWLTMLIALGVVWVVYLLTLAPEVTLEDSGELCTGAFYAGIPHPPGYPFWTLYSWLWSNLLPIGNVAWRVEVGESFGAALACGLVGLMVSRGSSMLIEGIEDLKGLPAKWEKGICIVCGAVSGIMLGLGRTMWSESVAINRISLFGIPWVMLVLLCLMRWIYSPKQLRYLFTAMFLFGICGTIHQTLLCAALGIEAAIAVTRPRLGRTFFLANSIMFLGGVVAKLTHLTDKFNDLDQTLLYLYVGVGLASIALYFLLAITTKAGFQELCRDGALVAAGLLFVFGVSQGLFGKGLLYTVLCLAAAGTFAKFAWDTRKLGLEWLVVLVCAVLGAVGMSFYFYEPLAGMTNPPMQWGYPRTVDGFWHALSRGQYDKAHPTDLFSAGGFKMFLMQLGQLASGIAEEYNWVLLFVALVPLLFFFKMQKRERCWMIALTAFYLCIGILLVILMNPQDDRGSVDLHRVFFASSHGVIAILIGYGLALTIAYMALHYEKFRITGLLVGGVALMPALVTLGYLVDNTFFGGAGVPKFNTLLLLFLIITAAFVLAGLAAQMLLRAKSAPAEASGDEKFYSLLFGGLAALCVCLAAYLAFFMPDLPLSRDKFDAALPSMFALRVASFPALAGLIILGIVAAFIVSLLVYRERAPLAITLGLLVLMPVTSLMSHWGVCEQRNHWFGYWFGHDMFTPPFVGPDGKLTYDPQLRAEALKGANAALVYPEMPRDAVLYGGTDPGRFCPTYMIFCESFTAHSQQPTQDQHFDRRDAYIITQNALADPTYMQYIRAHYNRSTQIDPPFFQELLRSEQERVQNYTTNRWARLAYQLLDKPFTKLGADIEARRRREGVYPPKEIYIATPQEIQQSYDNYEIGLQQRWQHDQNRDLVARDGPQLRPGEAPTQTPDGRYTISGNTSVMAINGLLTKVMFDKNPTNEFFVEESFPLEWMFPHLTPFGDIMKINREPLDEIPESEIRRDHEFWSHYSDRLIGNWITYDTSIKEIVDFVEKVYVRHDFTGFKGDRRFIRDDQAQKSFSKLRGADGGIYAWRLGMLVYGGVPTPPQYVARGEAQARMMKEVDFAYRQAFAFCPYSPEIIMRYAPLLANIGRLDDAILITETAYRMDPNNGQLAYLVRQLHDIANSPGRPRAGAANPAQAQASLEQLEKQFHANPSDFQQGFALAQAYMQLQQKPKVFEVLDQMLTNTNADLQVVIAIREAYVKLNDYTHLEVAQERLTQVAPGVPESWYDLAGLQALMGKNDEALKNLRRALDGSAKRLAKDPKAADLRDKATNDPQLLTLRQLPEFQQLTAPPK